MSAFRAHLQVIFDDFEDLQKQNGELATELAQLRLRMKGEGMNERPSPSFKAQALAGNDGTHETTKDQAIVESPRMKLGPSELSETLVVAKEWEKVEKVQCKLEDVKCRFPSTHSKTSSQESRQSRHSKTLNNDRSAVSVLQKTEKFQKTFAYLRKDLSEGEGVSPAAILKQLQSRGFDLATETIEEGICFLQEQVPSSNGKNKFFRGLDERMFMYLMEELEPQLMPPPVADMKKEFSKLAIELASADETAELVNAEKVMKLAAEKKKVIGGRMALLLDVLPASMICLNALVIGISSDLYEESFVWQVVEYLFNAFFIGECLFKIKLYGFRGFFLGPDWPWNAFDVFCIFTALAEMAITEIMIAMYGAAADLGGLMLLKMLRLARLARLIRLLRFRIFHELRLIVQGVISGVKVLFWALVLLGVLIFLLGVPMRKMVGQHEPEFSTLMKSMFSIFRCVTDGCSAYDGTPLQERLYTVNGFVFMLCYMLVFLFVTIGIFNLIMATFIDNVLTANIKKKQQELGENVTKHKIKIKDMCWNMLKTEDSDLIDGAADVADVCISRARFNSWLKHPVMIDSLEDVDIETSTKFELFDVLDVDMGGELSFSEITSGLMSLRGPISKSDLLAVRLKACYMTRMIQAICEHLKINIETPPNQ